MKMKEWSYYSPVFESDELNPEMMKYSPWSGHRRFAYDYMAAVSPSCIVELGSYYGCSAFTFLQALKDFRLDSSFYAIDTWAGDSFTQNDYKEDIYGQFKGILEAFFRKQNAKMLRMTFDQAVQQFEDGTIDLLHIDGSHKYEDVKHDFETWLPKVKKNGVIFFHDVSEDKLDGEFLGSHIFWEEIRQEYPWHLEFPFSFGLGMIFLDRELYLWVKNHADLSYYQKMENHQAVCNKDVIRKQYFAARSADRYIASLKEQVQIGQDHLARYKKSQEEKDAYIRELEERVKAGQDTIRELAKKEEEGAAKLRYAEARVGELTDTIGKYKETVDGKEAYIEELSDTIGKYKETMDGKDAYIGELTRAVGQYQETVAGKDTYIGELTRNVGLYQETVAGKDAYIGELTGTIGKYQKTVDGKEAYIQELSEKNTQGEKELAEMKDRVEKLQMQADNFLRLKQQVEKLPFGAHLLKGMEI